MSNKELLMQMSRENERLRTDAARSVESGMEALVGSKRIIQKLNLTEVESEETLTAITKMVNAGIALRVMMQVHKQHHQRQEEAWLDKENSTGTLFRTALAFEGDANEFAEQLRNLLDISRKEKRAERRRQPSEPEPTQDWSPTL